MGMMQGRKGKRGFVAEINVTPLVDVMLVLLIIFMVTAPMMTQGMLVNLPETTTKPLTQKEEPLVVIINKEGVIYLGKVQVSAALLKEQLTKMSVEQKDRPVYLQADKDVPYGVVVGVMADMKESGFEKIGMITKPVEKQQ